MPGLTGLEVAAAAAAGQPAHAGGVRHRLRPVRDRRLRARRGRLPAQADRARAPGARPCSACRRASAAGSADARALAALLAAAAAALPRSRRRQPLTWITASAGSDTRLILVDDVAYFRADNKYTMVMTAEGEALLRKPIRELLDVLDPADVQADPPLHHRQPEGDRLDRARRHRQGRGAPSPRPETLTVSQPFMALFKQM